MTLVPRANAWSFIGDGVKRQGFRRRLSAASHVQVVQSTRSSVDRVPDDVEFLFDARSFKALCHVPRRIRLKALDQVQPAGLAIPAITKQQSMVT